MNAPKAIATLAVVAIVACILYATFVPALPTEETPFEISAKEGTSTGISLDDGEVVLDMQTFVVTSHMGETLEDVAVEFGIDGETDYPLGTVDFGDIEPGASSEAKLVDSDTGEDPRIPLAVFMASLRTDAENGTVYLPLVAGFGFKYVEWADGHILDMKVGVDVKLEQGGTMTVESTDAGVQVRCELGSGSIASLLEGTSATFEETSSGVVMSWTADEGGYVLAVDGTSEELEKALEEKGSLTLAGSSGGSAVLEGAAAESFVSMVRSLEDAASKEAGE